MLNTRSTTLTPLFRLIPVVVACMAASACSDTSMTVLDVNGTDSSVRQTRTQLDIVSGQSQVGQVNSLLPTPLGVKVTDQAGNPLVGVTVYWSFAGGGGAAAAAGAAAKSITTTTDNGGVARAYWLLGTQAGSQGATAGLSSNTNKGNGKGNGSQAFYAQATPGDPANVVVKPRAATLSTGKDTTFTADVSDRWDNPIANAQVAWSATPSGVATVNGKGRVSTVSPGTATVKATAGTATGTAAISVTGTTSAAVSQVSASPSSLSLAALGATAQISATATDSQGSTVTADLQWRSIDPGIATVDASGIVTSVANGSTLVVVSATCCAVADTVTVTVSQLPQTVVVSPTSVDLSIGGADTLSASVEDANGHPVAGATITWLTNATGVATVSAAGIVTGVAQGSATITAKSGNATGTASISVTGTTSPTVSGVTASPSSLSFAALGATAQVSATATDSQGSSVAADLQWQSLDPTIATVDASGHVTALANGSTAIVVSTVCCAVADTVPLAVTQVAHTVTISSSLLSLNVGGSASLSALVKDSNGYLMTNATLAWSSSATNVASVNSTGVVNAIAQGSATIIAKSGPASDSASVSVTGTTPQPPQGLLFSDGFESGDLSHAGNGFSWSSPNRTQASNLVSHTGSYSLRFRYPGGAPGTDAMAEQRFAIARTDITECWIEYYIYYPNGSEGFADPSAKYFHRAGESPSNNKFLRLWGGSYGGGTGSNELGFETQPNGTVGDESMVFKYLYNGSYTSIGYYGSPKIDPWVNNSYRGRWIQVRMHLKMSKGSEGPAIPGDGAGRHYGDGIARMWWDGAKVFDFDYWGQSNPYPYWDQGYLMGYANSGFDQQTYVFIDDFKFYTSDPGWSGDN